jgi:large subunit ribosomal protein L13
MDTGDHVIVLNAEKIALTGRKAQTKVYYRHSGYLGGLKETSFERMIDKHPERVIELAIKGMLPHNSLGRQMFRKLKVYAGTEHPHEAQQPKVLDLRAEGE